MSKATKLQIENIKKLANLLGIKVETTSLTSEEASILYRKLLFKLTRGNKNDKK